MPLTKPLTVLYNTKLRLLKGKMIPKVSPKKRVLHFSRVNLHAVMCTQCPFLVSYERKSEGPRDALLVNLRYGSYKGFKQPK